MKYLLICTLFSSNLALAQQPLGYPEGSYQQGYQQGYQLGQCGGSIYCTTGAAPAAPAPQAGQDSYESGIYQGIHDKEIGADEFHSDIESYKNWPNNYDED